MSAEKADWWDRIDAIGTTILVVAAIVLATIAIQKRTGGDRATQSSRERYEELTAREWRTALEGRHVRGRREADVMIVEFGRFDCRWCKVLGKHLVRLMGEMEDHSVGIVFRHFPTEEGSLPYQAAIASECAARQGAFWEYHDHVLDKQQDLSSDLFLRAAEAVNIEDIEGFRQCLANKEPSRRVLADRKAAERIGVSATPTLIVDGTKIDGTPAKMEDLRSLVKRQVVDPGS